MRKPSARKRWLIALAVLVSGGLLFWFLSAPGPSPEDQPEKIPEVAPALAFPDLSGKTV